MNSKKKEESMKTLYFAYLLLMVGNIFMIFTMHSQYKAIKSLSEAQNSLFEIVLNHQARLAKIEKLLGEEVDNL
jgi:hypothetical protein